MTGSSRSSEKEAFWRLAVEEHRASGLSVRAFCKRESLAEPSFYSWRKKLERRDGERSVTCRSPSTASQAMVPVNIVGENCSAPASLTTLEVSTPSGFTFRFDDRLEPSKLCVVLQAIASCEQSVSTC